MLHRIGLLLTFFLLCCSFAGAQEDPNLEAKAREIDGLLIAPCCWRQPVSVHFSAASDEVKAEVRRLLKVGLTRDEILDKFVAEYGERILAKPRASGFSLLAYFLPVVFLVLGAGVALLIVRKLRPRATAAAETAPAPTAPLDPKLAKELNREMWG